MTIVETDKCFAIPTTLIEPDPEQPRKEFDPAYIEGLGRSIAAEGLLQPITVRPNPAKPGFYLIITGECRWRAHCVEGLQTVKCHITEKCEDGAKRFRTQVMENMARQKMTVREEANSCKKMKALGDSEDVIANAMGMYPARVRILQKMAELSDDVWLLIESGSLQQWLVERVLGSPIPGNQVEGLLMRCRDKDYKKAGAIFYSYLDAMNQGDFSLNCEAAGIAGKKVDMARQVATQVMEVGAMIESLSLTDRAALARKIAESAAEDVAHTAQNKRGAMFLAQVMKNIDHRL